MQLRNKNISKSDDETNKFQFLKKECQGNRKKKASRSRSNDKDHKAMTKQVMDSNFYNPYDVFGENSNKTLLAQKTDLNSIYSTNASTVCQNNESCYIETAKKDSSDDGIDRSKDSGHFVYKIGQKIKNYKVIKHLGDGTFGRCLEVQHTKNNRIYAMKMIRAVERYIDAAKMEKDILIDIGNKSRDTDLEMINLVECFDYKKNYCMVFERLGQSLYDFIKDNSYQGYPISYVQSFFKQILEQIQFIHFIKLTHTDLKPENILLVDDTKIYQKGGSYQYPKSDKIKVIDFGGATYDHEHHSSIINTRQYRAPEVILQSNEWNQSSDAWSIGCIIMELYTGELYFETHQSYEHIALIEKSSGRIPQHMAFTAKGELADDFQRSTKSNKLEFNWPKRASDTESLNRVKKMKTFKDLIKPEHKELQDLVMKMLEIDPEKRISCNEALKHEFFTIKYENV